jgi:citrate synthase
MIPPFAIPSKKAATEHTRAKTSALLNNTRLPKTEELSAFNQELAREGYIPKHLTQALTEIGILQKEAKKLANSIAILIHEAIHKAHKERSRAINKSKGQRDLYRKHMQGKTTHQTPPPENLLQQEATEEDEDIEGEDTNPIDPHPPDN